MFTIFVLKCDENKYFVGKTNNIDFGLNNNFDSENSEWIIKYKPIKIEKLYYKCEVHDEDKYTIKYMKRFGKNNVRGGIFSKLDLDNKDQEIISKMMRESNNNKCILCGSSHKPK